MLNVQDLERRWLKYKIRSKVILFLPLAGILVLVGIFLIYLASVEKTTNDVLPVAPDKQQLETLKTVDDIKSNAAEVKEQSQEEIAVEHHETTNQESSSLVLKPSLHFMDNIEDDLSSPYINNESSNYAPENTERKSEQNDVVKNSKTAPKVVEVPTPEIKNTALVTRSLSDDNSDLKDVIQRFKKNKNPVLGLFIAKRYYDSGEYQKSYNYALITNEIDKNIEDSWIIFAKSLAKLGQNELAVNTLKSYLKTTKSTKASTLLQKIQSGEFK